MKIKKATMQEISKIETLVKEVVSSMNEKGLLFWNEFYPLVEMPNDIQKNQLYMHEEGKEIVFLFSLCLTHLGDDEVLWHIDTDEAIYLNRLMVNPKYQGKGCGVKAVKEAIKLAKKMKKTSLRVFAVEENIRAVKLYRKLGFKELPNSYTSKISDEIILTERVFEYVLVKEKPCLYDKDNFKPIIRCSICTGEQIAGFKNIHTNEFQEIVLIKQKKDLEKFLRTYGLSDIEKEY